MSEKKKESKASYKCTIHKDKNCVCEDVEASLHFKAWDKLEKELWERREIE